MATRDQIYEAAIKWCGEKERETFNSDIEYFQHNWSSLPGLRAYVERVVAEAISNRRA
jgi:hypothetical protein